jgi:hypothetical protein
MGPQYIIHSTRSFFVGGRGDELKKKTT